LKRKKKKKGCVFVSNVLCLGREISKKREKRGKKATTAKRLQSTRSIYIFDPLKPKGQRLEREREGRARWPRSYLSSCPASERKKGVSGGRGGEEEKCSF